MNENESTALYAFRKFGNNILRTAYACSGNYQEAEDITQEVFLSLHSRKMVFSDDEHLKAWLLRVTINKCRNFRKSFRHKNTQSIEDTAEWEMKCGFTHEDTEIIDMIKALPEKYSSVIFLYYYEGYKVREIGEILGISENTASSLLQRARKKLKIELEQEGYYEY